MRIALYNQMFALNGKSPLANLIGHWAVHFQSNEENIWKRTDINRTIDVINKSKADVVGITEILEGQEKELAAKLNELGYKYLFFGSGHRTKFRKLYVKVVLASKIRCEQVEISGFPVKDEMGGGGGIIDCYFPELQLNLINVHLACAKKEKFLKQREFLRNYLEKKRNKIVLLGDFNSHYQGIKELFSNLQLVSEEIKTCSVTPLFKWFSCKDLDHIFVKGLTKESVGELKGYSDHKLIYVDLN